MGTESVATTVIYHGNCADGFAAAWAARQVMPKADYTAGFYNRPPPQEVAGRDVYLVDFSYKQDGMDWLVENCVSVTVLDHHKTAAEIIQPMIDDGRVQGVFDMDRSGAGITWDYFHPGKRRPKLIDHIEDRDLWRFLLPNTREIQACVFSHPYDFQVWSGLVQRSETPNGMAAMILEGEAITRKQAKDINELLGVSTRNLRIGGVEVPAANLPYTLSSDACHIMAVDQPFAACYFDKSTERMFSLRSAQDGLDVSEIAKLYGGGGHRHAAGFEVSLKQIDQFEV